MRAARTTATAITLAAALAIGGCGVNDPYADNQGATPAKTEGSDHDELTVNDETTDVTTGDVGDVGGAAGAERVAREFAVTSLTYSPDTYVAQQRSLRARATGAMSTQLEPPVPDEDTAKTLAASKLTSRARVLVSDIESSDPKSANVIVLLKVFTGTQGRRRVTPDYQPYRVRLRQQAGTWKVFAMDAP
ncbi:MAG: hypothetical protein Q7T55_06440 [Solirubrobacteraceae bacterium]|nr:hypothetical protein [Solirubrobacteraceae bacterium]